MRKAKAINQDTNLNIRIDSDLLRSFREVAELNGLSVSKALRNAMADYIKKGAKNETCHKSIL